MQEKIIILDFGSQTTQLIGRRIRELNIYCEIVPYNKYPFGDESVIGIILSGSPSRSMTKRHFGPTFPLSAPSVFRCSESAMAPSS